MSFEDAVLGGGADFDPFRATDELIRRTAPEYTGVPVDMNAIQTRLGRKIDQLNYPVTSPSAEPQKGPALPDFSAQSEPVPAAQPAPETNSTIDFSSQSEPLGPIGPEPPPPTTLGTVGTYAKEFGKGALEGGKNMGAAALKGTAALGIPSAADTGMLDELALSKDYSVSQRTKLMKRALTEFSDKGLHLDYNAALRRIAGGADPAAEVEALRPKFEANNKAAATPVTELPLFKAGEAVENFGKEALAPAPGFESGKSMTRDLGSGAGSMVAGIAVSMIPGIGPAAAGSLFTASGMGEAVDKAAREKAPNEEMRRIAMLGGVAGATDMADTLLPMLGSTGRVLGFVKRMGIAAVKGAMIEGGQEGLQQLMQNAIAKHIYKPDQDYGEDVGRSMLIAAILGGGAGALSGAAHSGAQTTPVSPPPLLGGSNGTNGGATAGASGGPGPAPSPGGARSSPEDIDAFNEEVRRGNPPPPHRERDPATMSDAERVDAFTAARDAFGGAGESDILRQYGYDQGSIDLMSGHDRINEVIKAGRDKTAKTGKFADQNESAPNQEQPEKPEAKVPDADDSTYSVLRAYGYTDEHIARMPPRQRASEVKDAIDDGVDPVDAAAKFKRPATKSENTDKTSTAPEEPDTTGLRGMGKGMAGGIADSMYDHLWSRVEAGAINETTTGPASALLQGAKLIRARGGMTSIDDLKAYGQEQGKLDRKSPTFQKDMRALVEKYSAKGHRASPINPQTAEDVAGAQPVEPKSEAQAGAENYQHAHLEMPHLGLAGKHSISVETGLGQERKGIGEDGKPWSVKMTHAAYGRIKGTVGADGQHLDVFIGPHPTSPHVFVIDQYKTSGNKGFDEHKVLVGYRTPIDALHAYSNSYTDGGKDRIGGVTAFSADQFQNWLKNDNHTTAIKKGPTAAAAGPKGSASALTEAESESVPKEPSQPQGHQGREARDDKAHEIGQSSVGFPTYTQSQNRDGTVGEPAEGTPSTEGGADAARPSATDAHAGAPAQEAQPSDKDEAASAAAASDAAAGKASGEGAVEAVEAALGPDADKVAPVDIARAAEIMADNEGMDAATAFGQAVAESVVEQGFITEQQAEEVYGPEIKSVLEAGREGAPRGSEPVEQSGAEPVEVGPGDTEKAGKPESGSKAGEGKPAEDAEGAKPAADAGAKAAVEPAAGRDDAAGDKAGNAAEHQPAAKDADYADLGAKWGFGLTEEGRRRLAQSAGMLQGEANRVARMAWHYVPDDIRARLQAAVDGGALEAILGPAKGADKSSRKVIGKNRYGQDVSEDGRGVRSYAENGIRLTEPVRLTPRRDGGHDIDIGERTDSFQTAEESAPTWAQMLNELPILEKSKDSGRAFRDIKVAFDLMTEITGDQSPKFGNLTPVQKHELLDKINASKKVESPQDQAESGQRAVYTSAGDVFAAQSSGKLKQIPEREGFCYKYAGDAAIAGTGDLVIGTIGTPDGRRIYHAVVETYEPGNAAGLIYDPTFDAYFDKTVYSQVVDGFVEMHRMTGGPVRRYGQEHGTYPDAKGLGLPAIETLQQRPTSIAEDNSDAGVQTPLPASDATAGPENVQPAEPGGDAGPVRAGQGDRGAPAVPRPDEGVTEGAGGEGSVRAGDGADAGISAGAKNPATAGKERATQSAADVAFASLPEDMRVLIQQLTSDHDAGRTVPATLPLTTVRVADLPRVLLDESDRGSSYAREMDIAKIPPILIADGQLLDGKHRIFKAREDGIKTLSAIDLSGIADPRSIKNNGMGRIGKEPAASVAGENFTIEPGALDEGRSFLTKARDNIKALELAKQIEGENRPATRAEQEVLARYVGWGGIKGAFPDTDGKFAKGFETIGARLKELLGESEYETARRSIQYAHYTSEAIVRSMWAAVERMGFKGGQVFEPGMGSGNFAGMMPGAIAANSHYAGVEFDHTTARIAKLLYPKWGIRHDDFTKMPLAADTFDLVIGNPPFADIAIKSDKAYPQGFLLHDYFFAKSLDAVRPGGLLAFISSAGTMNKLDSAAREYLADRADFVGGIRLPGDAFKKNAGTEVTTDIIFLRKRIPGDVPVDRRWTETEKARLPGPTGAVVEGMRNAWFATHPDMVLGEEGFFDKLYKGRYAVRSRPGSDIKADLTAAIDNLPADVMTPWEQANTDQTARDFTSTEKKDGTYYFGPDGELYQMSSGSGQIVGKRGKGVENGRTTADLERIKGLIPVRDALRDVYAADLASDTGNAARAREALNRSYDAFVEKFGPINKAVIQRRRPNLIQMEAARLEAREEARYAGAHYDDGSFDPTRLLMAGASTSVVARERQKLREQMGTKFDEGAFEPDETPDVLIDKRPNVDPFMDDPESYRLRAIEDYDEISDKAKKKAVFTENVISRWKPPTISSVNDALLYSLSQYGRVNLPEMARLARMSESEVIEKLGDQVFEQPDAKGSYVTKDEYLSGDVRKKLLIAKDAAERNPNFKRNETALEAAQPVPLAPSQITATMGMPWIPAPVVKEFALNELGLEKLSVKYHPKLATWSIYGDEVSVAATSTWGTPRRSAPQLISDALNRQTPKIYDRMSDDTTVLNVAATEAANDKIQQIKQKFADWIWSDEARADKLAQSYNDNYNNLVVRQYDGEYLTTPGIASSWSWRPHQKRVIARIIQSGNTYVAHAVGAGKTSEYIGAIMEMRRLGLVKKPMVAVPNHMLGQFTKEWYEQYPTAKLAIADDRRFHTDRRKQFIANVANDDLDAIIITHSSFGLIPVSQEFEGGIIRREIEQYRELLGELTGSDNRITRSRVEKQIERLEQRLASRASKKDAVFTFEEMGVDHLTIDEAHLFRKLDFATKMSSIKGVQPEGSKMAWDLYIKTQYLDSIRPGRGLVLGSGTPITNTMAELFSLSRYMQPQALDERGLGQFDAWAGAFGESVSELEQDAAGGYKYVSRFAQFVNVAELSAMVRQVMDVVSSEQLSQYVTRPAIKGGKRTMILAEKSKAMARLQNQLAERMRAIRARKGPPQKGEDNLFKVIGDGRHAAIDMRLSGPNARASEVPSKLDLMVSEVIKTWNETKKTKFHHTKPESEGGGYQDRVAFTGPATQLVFVNLGLHGRHGFAVPDYIRSQLVRAGVPKSEIAFMNDYKGATQKQRLFNDMNDGKVRILIGSVAGMGIGTNVQRRLIRIHNQDPLWYPADDTQRLGRGIRQGNMNPEIEITDYATKGTYDSAMWGMMAKKAKFIEGFFNGDPSLRTMDDLGESSQFEQAKALTTADPRLIRFTELKQELEKAQRRKSAFDSDLYALKQKRSTAANRIEYYTQRITQTEADIAQRIVTTGEAFNAKIGEVAFDKRAEFGKALFDRLDLIDLTAPSAKEIKVAEVGGFPLYAKAIKGWNNKDIVLALHLALNGKNTRDVAYDASPSGTTSSIEHILRNFEGALEGYKQDVIEAQRFYDSSAEKVQAKFKGDAEIAALREQVNALSAELAATPAEAPPAPPEMPAAALDNGQPIMGTRLGRGPASQAGVSQLASPARITEGEIIPPNRMDPAKRAALEAAITKAIRHMLGEHVAIEFSEGLMKMGAESAARWGELAKPGAAGLYYPYRHLIQLALVHGVDSVAFHEAYHAAEFQLQTPQERALMERETPAIRKWIAKRRGYTAEQATSLADVEVRAIGAEEFLAEKGENAGEGLHVGVRRWYRKLLDMLRQLANALRGLGFNSYRDIYRDLYTGQYAKRAGDTPRPEADRGRSETFEEDYGAPLAAVHRGRPGGPPGPPKLDFTIADALADRNFSRLSSVSKALRFGTINLTNLRARLQDRFIRVQKAQDTVAGPLPTSQNTYQAESLFYGKAGFQLEELERNHFEPLIKEMKARDVGLEEFNDYLYATHAPERNAEMAAINPTLAAGSGMTDVEAADIIHRLGNRLADFQHLEAMARQIIQDTRDNLVRYGLISQEAADAWEQRFPNYVPLRGFDEIPEDQSLYARGKGFDTRARETQTAFGRNSKAAGPLPYIMMQAQMAIVRGEKNKVGNRWLRFVLANPDPARWLVDTPKMKRTIDRDTGLVTWVADRNWYNDPEAFVTKIGGDIHIIRNLGPDGENLTRALNQLGSENLGSFLRVLRAVTVTMSRLSTQWNPNFVLPNLVRDLGEAYINMQEQNRLDFVRHFTKHLIPAIGGAYRGLAGGHGGRYTNAFREFDEAGGRIRFFGIDNPIDLEKSINKQLRQLNGGVINSARNGAAAFEKAFENINGAMENATRLAAYMAARDIGMSKADSALLARKLTVDFNKKGELGSAMNALVMFANVGFQGAQRTAHALKSKRVRRASYGLIALGALSAMLAYGSGGDDDAGENYYSRIPEWIRDKNLIIMMPKGVGKDGGYITIPLPFLFGAFKVLGDRLAGVAMGREKAKDALGHIIKSIVDGLNPLGQEEVTSFLGLPSVLRPVAHIETNKNWTGKPLYPENQYDKTKPNSEQSFASNSTFSKEMARRINKASGGSRYQSGTFDWHPGSIDHVFETLTGGLGKFFSNVRDTAADAIAGRPADVNHMPIVRRFAGSLNTEQADRQAYFDRREEARKNGAKPIQTARKDAGTGVNKEEAESFLANNTNSPRGEQIFKNADEAIAPWRKSRAAIEAKDSYSDADRIELERLSKQIRDRQNLARQQYRQMKQQQEVGAP